MMKLKPIKWQKFKDRSIEAETLIGVIRLVPTKDDKYCIYAIRRHDNFLAEFKTEDSADTIAEAKKKGFAIYSNIIMGLFV